MFRDPRRLIAGLLLAAVLPAAGRQPALPDAALETASPRVVRDLRLENGWAVVTLEDGVLFPARATDGTTAELVFLGRGRVTLEPPDDVEAAQLELFTGSGTLDETFDEATLVVARGEAVAALLGRGAAEDVEPARAQRAAERFDAWRDGRERRLLGVDAGLLANALGDPDAEQFFAAAFHGEKLGDFLLLVDPADEEPLRVGQFVRLEATGRQKRRLSRLIGRQQRQGKLIDVEVDDLGSWDTWVSGRRLPGQPAGRRPAAFEPVHYTLDTTVQTRSGRLEGRAAIRLRALAGGHRLLRLTLHRDLGVEAIRRGDEDLAWLRADADVAVVLPDAPAAEEEVTVTVDYAGDFLDSGAERNWALRDTIGWYPHAGADDLATYDVTLRHPEKLDLLAGGTLVERGVDNHFLGGEAWERRRLDTPSIGFSFAVGRFEVRELRSRHVRVQVAFDPSIVRASQGSLHEISNAVVDSLRYYEDLFGRYPLDRLVVVTVPSERSQAMLGFITLSNEMMADWGALSGLLGLTDRRAVVAHEVAHQWWGHQIGWKGYRDQWISEAMANYAAQLWTRRRLGLHELEGLDPTAGWQRELTATLGDGRTVASLGPLVLGQRLSSSRSTDAYNAIVYRKGALVLGMLAREIGEERFLAFLRMLVEENRGRVLSTEDFLDLIEVLAEVDLEAFARQFVYGTVLPDVFYASDVTLTPEGNFRIRIRTSLRPFERPSFELVDDGGQPDVVRRWRDGRPEDAPPIRLSVPFQIAFVGTALGMQGVMDIDQAEDDLTFATTAQPRDIWLDSRQEVFATFTDENRQPKRVRLQRALEAVAAGMEEEARELFAAALDEVTPVPEPGLEALRDQVDRLLDAQIHLELARLDVDAGALADAEARVETARRGLERPERELIAEESAYLLARVELRRGNPGRALKRLRDVPEERRLATAEGCLLTVASASASGDAEELDAARRAARRQRFDAGGFRSR